MSELKMQLFSEENNNNKLQQQLYLFDINFNLQSLCLQLVRAIQGGHKRKKK